MGMGSRESRGTLGIAVGMEASVVGFPQGWNKMLRGLKNIYSIPAGMLLYLIFMILLHQQVNPTSDSFIYKTFGASLITVIMQI